MQKFSVQALNRTTNITNCNFQFLRIFKILFNFGIDFFSLLRFSHFFWIRRMTFVYIQLYPLTQRILIIDFRLLDNGEKQTQTQKLHISWRCWNTLFILYSSDFYHSSLLQNLKKNLIYFQLIWITASTAWRKKHKMVYKMHKYNHNIGKQSPFQKNKCWDLR